MHAEEVQIMEDFIGGCCNDVFMEIMEMTLVVIHRGE